MHFLDLDYLNSTTYYLNSTDRSRLPAFGPYGNQLHVGISTCSAALLSLTV